MCACCTVCEGLPGYNSQHDLNLRAMDRSCTRSFSAQMDKDEVCASVHPVPAFATDAQGRSEIPDRSASRWTLLFQKSQMACSHSALQPVVRVSSKSLKILIAALLTSVAYWVHPIFGNSTGGQNHGRENLCGVRLQAG